MRTYRIIQKPPNSLGSDGYILQERGILWGWNYVRWFSRLEDANKYLDELKEWVKYPGPKVIRQETFLERFD